MPNVRDSFNAVKGYLRIRSSRNNRVSRPSSWNEDVDMQDATAKDAPGPSFGPPPTPSQSMYNHYPSLENINIPQFPRPRSPSVTPMPDNEFQAQASLSVQCGMSFAAVVQELAPIPAIGPLIGCLTIVFQAVERARVNKEQWELLRGRCVMVARIAGAQVANYGGPDYPGLHNSAEMLHDTITTIGERATHFNRVGEIFALLQFQAISDEIRGHFAQLDVCLCMFSYTADVAQMQWIGELSAVQRFEMPELEEMKKLILSVDGNIDAIGKPNEHVENLLAQGDQKLQKILEDEYEIPQDRTTVSMTTQQAVSSFDAVTGDMSARDMFECLVKHGCTDLSMTIDPDGYSASAIASGGFGDVWQARMMDGTLVAVKCLRLHTILEGDKKGMKRTMRELYNWSKARNDNIQQLLGIVMFQERLGMVSIWRLNGNMQQYIEKNPGVERYPLCVQLTKGVAYLHGIGMIHGDLKAINILVCPNGTVKISDFDYSILSESTLRFSETSKSGGGTVRWMAPELLLLEEEEDAPPAKRNTKTDVYALGMTMLEIISGKVPYHQYRYDRAIIRALDKKEPPKCPEELSGPEERTTRMWSLLLECWDHDPEARPEAQSVLISIIVLVAQMNWRFRKPLEDKSEGLRILQKQHTTTMATYADAVKLVKTIRTVTGLQVPPQIILGRQCILEVNVPIKTGITCDTYAASFLGGEKIAKKVFRIGMSEKEHVRKYAERFLRDAKLWATFRSEFTLTFYGIGMEAFEGDNHFQLYMVSPLMENFDAVRYLKEHKSNVGIKQNIMRIITDAARGLQYLHHREPPVVHSGMRGDNILITDSGGAILGGFGLTKALQSSSGNRNDKIPPAVMTGKTESQRWMAPEMFEDDSPVLQTPSDIWGWAMATLELVSGNAPYFRHKQHHTLMLQIGTGKTPTRKDHAEFDKYALQPDELWALLERCWAMSPGDRPTIDEVIVELERIKAMAGAK